MRVKNVSTALPLLVVVVVLLVVGGTLQVVDGQDNETTVAAEAVTEAVTEASADEETATTEVAATVTEASADEETATTEVAATVTEASADEETTAASSSDAALSVNVSGLLLSNQTAAYDLNEYWGNVPVDGSSVASQVPTGCTCAVPESPCTKFDCGCVCDLTAGACDPNCCCDAECTAEAVAIWNAHQSCLPEGPQPLGVEMCTDSAYYYQINPKYRMQVNVMDQLLCVTVDNNPTKGEFFGSGASTLVAASVFLQDGVLPTYTFQAGDSSSDSSSSSSSDSSAAASSENELVYAVGDPIPVVVNVDGNGELQSVYAGSFILPGPDSSGHCNDHNPVGFLEDPATTAFAHASSSTPSSSSPFSSDDDSGSVVSCSRVVVTSAGTCADGASAFKVWAMSLGKVPSARPQEALTGSGSSNYAACLALPFAMPCLGGRGGRRHNKSVERPSDHLLMR